MDNLVRLRDWFTEEYQSELCVALVWKELMWTPKVILFNWSQASSEV